MPSLVIPSAPLSAHLSLLSPKTPIHSHLNSAILSPLSPPSSAFSAASTVEYNRNHHTLLSNHHQHAISQPPHPASISNAKPTPIQTGNIALSLPRNLVNPGVSEGSPVVNSSALASSLFASPLSPDYSSSDANSAHVDTVTPDDVASVMIRSCLHVNLLHKRLRDDGRLLKRIEEIKEQFCMRKNEIQSTRVSVFVQKSLWTLLQATALLDQKIQKYLKSRVLTSLENKKKSLGHLVHDVSVSWQQLVVSFLHSISFQ